jgi:hypothetical protein
MAIKGVVHVSCPMHFIIHVWLWHVHFEIS